METMERMSLFFRFLVITVALLVGMTCVAQKKVVVEKRPADLVITKKPDDLARFPKGNVQAWIARHVEYPEVVHSSGNRYLDREGVRVVGSMPQWQPARKAGHPVNVEFTTPVHFRLTHKTNPAHEPMAPWDK